MKTLYFNRLTLLGEFKTPVSLDVQVPDDFTLTKEVDEVDKIVQKEDEEGNKIYLKEVFNVTTEEIITGYDETLTETELPCMITVQEVDEEGNKLFTENIYDEEGEVIDTMTSTKPVNETGEKNAPLMKEVQKTSDSGNLVYLKPIIKVIEHKEFDHFEETTEETETPCMVEVFKKVSKELISNPECFDIYEVLNEVYLNAIDKSQYDYIVADIFLNEEDLDLEKSFANTGVGILQLPPKGYAVTKPIVLEQASKTFKVVDLEPLPTGITMYINTKKVVNGEVTLANATSKLTIKFTNTTDKYLDIKSYTILY